MKHLLGLFVWLFALLFVQAQPETPMFLTEIPEDVLGYFHLEVGSGAMLDRRDGTLVLVLEKPADLTYITFEAPQSLMGQEQSIDTLLFTRAWRGLLTLEGEGILHLEDIDLRLTLQTPLLNPETKKLSFTAIALEVVEPVGMNLADISLNRRFTSATLDVVIDPVFGIAIAEGIELALEKERDCACQGVAGLVCEICNSGF